MTSYIAIHSGNDLAIPWVSALIGGQFTLPLADDWPGCDNLDKKITYAKENNFCSELTVADGNKISIDDLVDIKKHFTIIKVVSNYETNVNHLSHCWLPKIDTWINDYNLIKDESWPERRDLDDWYQLPLHVQQECQEVFGLRPPVTSIMDTVYNEHHWLESLFYGLSLSDQILNQDTVTIETSSDDGPIIFTPGRCGTHVVKDITGVEKFLHHDLDTIHKDVWKQISQSKKIVSVMRRHFVKQVFSDAIASRYGIMITRSQDLKKSQETVDSWHMFEITNTDIIRSLKKLVTFADRLLGLHLFYNKPIEFSTLENLKDHYDQIDVKKNPYRYQDLISNYQWVVDTCDARYQPFYDGIVGKLVERFGDNDYRSLLPT